MPPQAPNLTKLLSAARKLSEEQNKPLTTTQLFGSIIGSNFKVQGILQDLGFPWEVIYAAMIANLPKAFPQLFEEPAASEEVNEVLTAAQKLAEKDGFVDVEHLLLAIIQGSTIRAWMDLAEFPRETLEKEVAKLLDFSPLKIKDEDEEKDDGPPPNMMKYCFNLSAEAMLEGQRVFGREKEINEILDTVVRAKKNNVLLIGENGVGRKSICRGVAERIISGRASEFSQKALWQLDVQKLSVGSGMYGALEAKVSNLSQELAEDGEVILVIPDIHTTVGAGGKEGTVDVANLLKPLLSNPKVPVIGICTQAEYKKYLEKDSSLVNLFEIIRVDEPAEEETRKILVRSLPQMEEHHLVNIEFAAVDETINLCKRFLPYRKFPEKAFDILDMVCAKKKNSVYIAPPELLEMENKLWDRIMDNASFGVDMSENSAEREKISKMEQKLGRKYEKWSKNLAKNRPTISEKDVVSTFVEKFKISESLIYQSQSHLTSDLSDRIRQEVHGQDHAIEAVCDVLVCSKAGLRDKTKPLAKFLFVGSSGTGKTFLGRKIAKYYFGDEKAMLKLDMSEFQEKHSISALTGAPPGYIGHDDGGRLTEYVKNHPSSVILFDEIEKAHPDIANILLQIMDDGCLTDSKGYRVDFTNSIIIITGNIGSGEKKVSMGFHNQIAEGENYKIALKKHFRPEFLARLDDPIVFNELDEKTMLQILWDSLNNTIKNLEKQKTTLTVDQSLVDCLLKQAKDQEGHARNIQSIVRKTLETPLAKRILKDKPKQITAKIENNKLELV